MGAFFLYHKDTHIIEPSVDKLYTRKGFKKPLTINIGDYFLKLYKKQLIDTNNYYRDHNYYVFSCGSLFYKRLSFSQSLKTILAEFIEQTIDPQQLYGNYVLIFYNELSKDIAFYIDPAFIKNVYFDPWKKMLSSDFLALLEALPTPYSLNSLAIIENLTTGNLISPDTYVTGIHKLDRTNFSTLGNFFPGIHFKTLESFVTNSIATRDDAIHHANQKLNEYFKAVGSLSAEFGTNIGLTGGFDSRLLLMHARKHLPNLMANSFWRPYSIEYQNAKKLARVAGLDFFSFEKVPFQKPDINEILHQSFFFYDGQTRSQNRWDEEFNLPEYNLNLSCGHYAGFHGCGGEQYRNADRLSGTISLKSYILYEWMYKQCESTFLDKKLQSDVYANIEQKIKRLIGFNIQKVNLVTLKKIQNEIWNQANRTTRVNVLNQQQFYFAPFTEYQISHNAYSYIPFLGNSLSFEIQMMRNLDPTLSAVKTNYGFSISEGEPVFYKSLPYIVAIIPKSVFYKLYFTIKGIQSKSSMPESLFAELNPFLLHLGQKIDLHKLSHNKNLGSSIVSLNYLLNNARIFIK